jgi:carbonic anhydrase
MKRLVDVALEFKEQIFNRYSDLFKKLKNKQKPHTLFIGCSDSRVVPVLITKSLPGELFIIRNIANIVPKYRSSEEFLSTTSAIEYAVQILEVKHIVVCGHSNCGGCAALYQNESFFEKIPHTKKWLELAEPVKQKVNLMINKENESEREWMTEHYNILEQVRHLFTYPFIKEKYDKNELQISGWYYIIETGEIFSYNPETKIFELLNSM